MRIRPVVSVALAVAVAAGCGPDTPTTPPGTDPPRSPQPSLADSVAPSAAPTAEPVKVPTPSPSSTAPVTPTGEVHWELLGPIRGVDGGEALDAVGFEDGYVVVDGSASIRVSSDGVVWKRVRLPIEAGVPTGHSVATDGEQVLVGGEYIPCRMDDYDRDPFGSCRSRPASWTSDDGVTWRSSGPWTGRIGPRGKAGSELTSVWSIPGRGWDAAQFFSEGDESDEFDPSGPALWHSDNGLAWSRLSAGPAAFAPDCDEPVTEGFWAVGDAAGRRVLSLPCKDGRLLSTSIDGRRYTSVGPPLANDDDWTNVGLAPTALGPWVFAGGRPILDNLSDAMVWTSEDLGTWTTTVLPVPAAHPYARAWALGYDGRGYVATGSMSGGGAFEAATWLSDDGRAWRLADVQPELDMSIDAIATGPAGTLAFGAVPVSGGVYELHVWRLERGP